MKAMLFFPSSQLDLAGFLVLAAIALVFVIFTWLFRRYNVNSAGRTIWTAGLVGFMLGVDLNNPVGIASIASLVFTSILGFGRSDAPGDRRRKKSAFPRESDSDDQLQEENELLRRRVMEQPQTFAGHASFFENMITLNEIQMLQGVVESATHLLAAEQMSLYQIRKPEDGFHLTVRYHRHSGLQLRSIPVRNDGILEAVQQSKKTLSVPDIARDKTLQDQWQAGDSRAMIYCPIHHDSLFIGILAIDEIEFQYLNRESARNLQTIARLTGLAYRNIRAHQTLLAKDDAGSDRFSEYHQFLKALNFEFKRADRNEIPLALLHLVVESGQLDEAPQQAPVELIARVRESCKSNLREVDLIFAGEKAGEFWIILPFTDFDGLSHVMERLNLITADDFRETPEFACHMGFCSLYQGIQQPKQMIESCLDSLQLHQTVCELVSRRDEKTGIMSD